MIRFLTAGESHGKCLIGILEGMPAGLSISEEEIAIDLKRRQQGYGRGDRMSIENDRAQILSGVRYGKTIGSPIALQIENKDWANWTAKMSMEAVPPDKQAPPITNPRPGHADYAGAVKYGFDDIRNVIERSSARETAMRAAIAAICRKFFREFGIVIGSHVTCIGGIKVNGLDVPSNPLEINRLADKSPVRCLDSTAEKQMMEVIDKAKANGDTVGGSFEVVIAGLPVGLGSSVHYDRRLDGILAGAMMAIPAIKSVGIGLGEQVADRSGSEVHDRLFVGDADKVIERKTNHAGGIEGGMSNGDPIVIHAAMKPLASLKHSLESVDLSTRKATTSVLERSDVCAVPAASIVGEAVALLALMNPFLEKFGGDSMEEIKRHIISSYKQP